jgi:molybdopterin-guanine dinucleotide biosynthesis adapter protein
VIPVILFSGYSNSGKTTVIEQVVSSLTSKGYDVTTVKHHKGDFELGGDDKDSAKHMKAGASRVILSSDTQLIDIKKLESERSLASILRGIKDADLVVVEGYKSTAYPKIEVYRSELGHKRLGKDRNIIGLVSDQELDEFVPRFGFDDKGMKELSLFIEDSFLKNRGEEVANC